MTLSFVSLVLTSYITFGGPTFLLNKWSLEAEARPREVSLIVLKARLISLKLLQEQRGHSKRKQ